MTPGAFSRIVVGTDGSDSATRALDEAARFAALCDAELLVVNAYGRDPESPDAPATREVGASLLRDAQTRLGDSVGIRAELREGDPADVLLHLAMEERADLLVVGNRGLGPKRQLIGSVPIRVAHRMPCSVLVAQTTASPAEAGGSVLVATDGTPTAARAVALGGRVARDLEAPVLIAHVGDAERGRGVVHQAAGEIGTGLDVETVVVSGDPAQRIVEIARDRGSRLAVVGNRGMTGWKRFLASVPSRVARRTPCHLLIAKTT